jgi:capsular polysaccharide biosynthesis protein
VEQEAENTPPERSWSPVVPVQSETPDTVAVAIFQWKRLPLTRSLILKYLALFCVIVIGTAMLGYVVASLGAPKYGARSEIDYPLAQENPSGSQLRQDRLLSTQLVALKSQAVLQPIATQYKMSLSDLSKITTVKVLADSEVLQVEVDNASKTKALALVGAIVSGYLKTPGPSVNALTEKYLQGQIDTLNTQINTLNAQIADAEHQRLAQNPVPAQSADELQKQGQLSAALTQRSTLTTSLNQATINQFQTPHITLLTQPYLLSGKVSPKPLQGAIAGFLAGIMIGALVIGLLIRRLIRRQPDPVG